MKPGSPRSSRGRLVALRRRDLGMSQEALARACVCSSRTIARIESDRSRNMSQRMIEALHKSLGMPLTELVGTRKVAAR